MMVILNMNDDTQKKKKNLFEANVIYLSTIKDFWRAINSYDLRYCSLLFICP